MIGCQALEYTSKNIYISDDGNRSEIADLAKELGCNYIARTDNSNAKAGNLNNTINQTNGELIVVFDADFIPTKNFLLRTVGFFQNEKVGLVQTPQNYYNADPVAHNLGLENVLTPAEEVFYRQIQPIWDAIGGVTCVGTSFVVRRSALEETNGFFAKSLSEDYLTGVLLAAKGYRLLYLNEKLSAGLAAENISAYISQKLRWGRSAVQSFFIDANPLTVPGIRPIKRLLHLEGLFYWFSSLSRVYLLIIPIVFSLFGIIPFQATTQEILYFFLPYYLVHLSVFSWLNFRSRSAFLSDIYDLAVCFPIAATIIQAMFNPFGKGFEVTEKGIVRDRYNFHWNLAWPLLLLFIATAISLFWNLKICFITGNWQIYRVTIGCIWSAYNLINMGVALLILVDIPKPDIYEWFDLQRRVKLNIGEANYWGITTAISEGGAEINLTQGEILTITNKEQFLPVTLKIMEENLELTGKIVESKSTNEFYQIKVKFDPLNLDKYRQLVEMLFCRPNQWKTVQTPGELMSLFLLFKILFFPHFLFGKNKQIRPIAVSKIERISIASK